MKNFKACGLALGLKLPDGFSVPPHWHPMDENVTVISGVFMLGFGERLDKAATRALGTGSYVMLPKGVRITTW